MSVLEIDYAPNDYQEEFHLDGITTRFRIIAGGRRVGKSKAAIQEAIKAALEKPNALVWWVSPTYKDAKEVGWEEFLANRDSLEPAIRIVNNTNLYVEFKNGSKIYFKGSDNYDSLRGRGVDFVIMDEAAFCKEDVWKKAIRPALSDKKGRAVIISSPNGRNWFHLQAVYAQKEEKNWKFYHWPSSLNPLLSEEDLNAARDELSDMDYRQEYLAEFVTKAGMVYQDFGEANIIDNFSPDPDRYEIYLGMDFGYASPSAIVFMAVNVVNQDVIQFDEIYVTRADMQTIVEKIGATLKYHGLTMQDLTCAYTDPAGNADEISSGLSPVDYMRKSGIRVVNKASRINPGLALVRSYVKSASGIIRYKVDRRCKETTRSLLGYTYKVGPGGIPTEEADKDGIHDHACDAVRYFFVNRFDHAKYVASSLDQTSYAGSKPVNKIKQMKQQMLNQTN